ncbi:MAG: isoaspartyl peptidase/L-asparaginase [Nitrosopumilus sp.]|nr:isoaspartyl peptidase/L-asparaginase [Nitrosopumilus sp.]
MTQSKFNNSSFGILIHGGAKTKKIGKVTEKEEIKKSLKTSIEIGFDLLKKGKSAVDTVEASVVYMEDSGVFNAGTGSCLTIDQDVEMDAAIMDGRDISAGSVGMVRGVRNPIKLARQVMEQTDHVMIVSEGALKVAKLLNMDIEKYEPNQKLLNKFNNLKKSVNNKWRKNNDLLIKSLDYRHDDGDDSDHGTVGAVAIDKEGNVASGVSTGGRWLKMHGRIGDSAVIGSGFYADNKLGAACATGNGEFIMRSCLCKYACDQMQTNSALISSKKSIALLTKRFGKNTGGLITVDTKGRFGISYNTNYMPVALINSKDEKINIALEYNQTSFK